jgi:prevent-host-death family protein
MIRYLISIPEGAPVAERRDVRPITQLKTRTAELVREVSERGRPITITQNGEAKVVVMDVERGRTMKQSEAFRRARKELERSGSNA